MKIGRICAMAFGLFLSMTCAAENLATPYGSSRFQAFDDIDNIEQLKAVFDFNFEDPEGVGRALIPISFIIKTVQGYGPVSFDPYDLIVVSHGSEAVVFAKQNYPEYKEIVDRAARLAELGVKFEICSVAANALGFDEDDFHGFVTVVPLGTYALAYHQTQGYALLPGAATVPADLINTYNRNRLGEKSNQEN